MHTQGCRVAGNVDPQVAMRGNDALLIETTSTKFHLHTILILSRDLKT